MKLSFSYMTNRRNPCFQWFADSLCNQLMDGVEVEVLVVDLLSDYDPEPRKKYFESCANGRFPIKVIPPKPCAWQGRHKKTREDYFAAANARNTAFIHSTGDYVICVDDLSVLCPEYVSNVIHAAQNRYVMMGSYRKCKELVVDNGVIKSHGEVIPDSRWGYGSKSGIVERPGNMLFGCSFGVPIEAAIKVNGFDEYCDGLGAEDYDFGIRLNRAEYKTFYNRNALTTESYEMHFQEGTFHRQNRRSHTGEDVDWYMVNRLNEQAERFYTLAKWTNIAKFREIVSKGLEIPANVLPEKDWATGLPFNQVFGKHKERG